MKKLLFLSLILISGLLLSSCLDDIFDKAEDIKDEFTNMVGELKDYANWCGPAHSGPDAALDSMDSCCETHDHCYEALNLEGSDYADCTEGEKLTCDTALVTCLEALDDDSSTWTVPAADATEAEAYKDDAITIFKTCETISDNF